MIEYFPSIASTYGISGYLSGNGGGGATAADLSGMGDDTTGQHGTTGEDSVSYDDGLYAAWTDPNTGIQYDVYGNPLPGQGL